MADNPLPPPPVTGNRSVDIWLRDIYDRVTKSGHLIWGQIDTTGGSVDDLNLGSLGTHIAATSAHGTTGDIVGAGDRPTATIGGSVLQASAIADLTNTVTARSSSYIQAEATAVANQAQNNTDKINAILAALRTSGLLGT